MIPRTRLLPRTTYVRDARIFVLAVEGEREEPWYFQGLRDAGWIPANRVKLVILATEDGVSAPEHVRTRLQVWLSEHGLIEADERWLVVDVDRHDNLQEVLNECSADRWSFAVSNPCFEVWLQLHSGDAVGTSSKAAKTAWRSWRQGRPNWPFVRDDVVAACLRAETHPRAADWVAKPAPGTGVHKVVRRLLSA